MKMYCKHTIAVAFLLAVLDVRSISALSGKVIIDTDAGADDAVAIMLAFQAEARSPKHEFEIIAITCTYGNTYVDNVEQNVLKILTVANRSDIPIYAGQQEPLLAEYTASTYFGKDGFGDFTFTEKITAKVDKSKYGVVALADLVKANPGNITLLSLGPSTNVAIAQALDPKFLSNLKNHIVLGGSVSGRGNVMPNIEFNFHQDPEANFVVLNKTTTKPLVLFPWETAAKGVVSKEWRENVLGRQNSAIVDFLNKAEKYYLGHVSSWIVSDAMAAAVMIRPDIVTECVQANVSPVVDGAARGSILVDYNNSTGKYKNAIIVQGFNVTLFKELLLYYLS